MSHWPVEKNKEFQHYRCEHHYPLSDSCYQLPEYLSRFLSHLWGHYWRNSWFSNLLLFYISPRKHKINLSISFTSTPSPVRSHGVKYVEQKLRVEFITSQVLIVVRKNHQLFIHTVHTNLVKQSSLLFRKNIFVQTFFGQIF